MFQSFPLNQDRGRVYRELRKVGDWWTGDRVITQVRYGPSSIERTEGRWEE